MAARDDDLLAGTRLGVAAIATTLDQPGQRALCRRIGRNQPAISDIEAAAETVSGGIVQPHNLAVAIDQDGGGADPLEKLAERIVLVEIHGFF